MASKYILIVASECDPEVESKYNQWYTDVHIPMFLQYEGIRRASRYRITDNRPGNAKYLAFYEFDSKEDLEGFSKSDAFAAAVKDFDNTWKAGEFKSKWGASYELIKAWEK